MAERDVRRFDCGGSLAGLCYLTQPTRMVWIEIAWSSSTRVHATGAESVRKAWAPGCTRSRPEEFHHGRDAEPRCANREAERRSCSRARTRTRPTSSGSRGLTAPLGQDDTIAGVYGRQLPHGERHTARAVLSRLPLWAEPSRPAPRRRRRAHVRGDPFSNVNSAVPRALWDGVSVRRGHRDERRPGVVASHPSSGTRSRYEPRPPCTTHMSTPWAGSMRRFFDSGVSAERSYVEGNGVPAALRRAGARYAEASSGGYGRLDNGAGSRIRRSTSREVCRPPARPPTPPSPHSPQETHEHISRLTGASSGRQRVRMDRGKAPIPEANLTIDAPGSDILDSPHAGPRAIRGGAIRTAGHFAGLALRAARSTVSHSPPRGGRLPEATSWVLSLLAIATIFADAGLTTVEDT